MSNRSYVVEKGYVTKSEFKRLFKDKQADIDEEIEQLTEAFRVFDKDNSGTISADEIRMVLSKCGEKLEEEEVEEMLKQIDIDGDGLISYEGITWFCLKSFLSGPMAGHLENMFTKAVYLESMFSYMVKASK